MKPWSIASLVLVVVVISACSGIRVEQNYSEKTDFTILNTYAWQTDKQPESGDIRIDNSLLDNRIRTAIDNALTKKRKNKAVRKQADFLVAYHYSIREREGHDSNVYTGIDIGIGNSCRRGSYSDMHIGLSDRNRGYDEGELTVDMLDPVSEQVIWRGIVSRKIINAKDPAERTARINETVDAILAKFPPLPGRNGNRDENSE